MLLGSLRTTFLAALTTFLVDSDRFELPDTDLLSRLFLALKTHLTAMIQEGGVEYVLGRLIATLDQQFGIGSNEYIKRFRLVVTRVEFLTFRFQETVKCY
jgi:hypothetical protein